MARGDRLRSNGHRRGQAVTETATWPHSELSPLLLGLDDRRAADHHVVGRKAANLARARSLGFPVLPGFVVTTAACSAIDGYSSAEGVPALVEGELRSAWTDLSVGGQRCLVVRSSSPGEDGGTSSMAGRFTSVLDVRGWDPFLAAVRTVIASGRAVAGVDGGDPATAAMAVLVQVQLFPTWGGVLFGVDPVTGRADRLVVAAVMGGPDQLVSGAVDGARYTLSRHGRLLATDGDELAERLSGRRRRALTRLARRAERSFGGHQDIEWACDDAGEMFLLQSRPVTAVGPAAEAKGPILGPGPVAETFPDPLAPLEQDLWLSPLRSALSEAVRLTGAASRRRLSASPVITAVGGRPAADLALLGSEPGRRSVLSRLDPRPPARRLRAAWRTGRLRAALPDLARDTVTRADEELASVPVLSVLADDRLLAVLRGSYQVLRSLHGYEILAGMLSSGHGGAPTAAAAALQAVAGDRAQGLSDAAIVARHPVTLSLVPPAIGTPVSLPPVAGPPLPIHGGDADELSSLREDLRLRARWAQQLTAQVAWELGSRLARRDLLAHGSDVRWLSVDELEAAVTGGRVPADVAERRETTPAAPLPAAFRLTASGQLVAVGGGEPGAGRGASAGRAVGIARGQDGVVEAGNILVVRTLDPGLAAVLPRLGGLVAETGSVLSHLAILARELHVPTVVGVADATTRFEPGAVLVVDGTTGDVHVVDQAVTEP